MQSVASQNLQTASLALPRSQSTANIADGRHATASPAATGFTRSVSGMLNASGASSPVPPASPRIPFASVTAGAGHHYNYDSRVIAQTINRIESTSGIGAVSNSVGSGNASAGPTAMASNEGRSADPWTAACIRTLPLLWVLPHGVFVKLS